MKAFRILLLGILLLFCQNAFAQTINSSVTIKISDGNYVVSGIVSSQAMKNAVSGTINTRLGANADFSRLTVQSDAREFEVGWFAEFDAALQKIKSWKSGVFIFSDRIKAKNGELSGEITSARFLLANGRNVSLDDFKNKVVVLFFNEWWNVAGVPQIEALNKLYPQLSSRNVEIISLSTETSPEEKRNLRKLYQRLRVPYKFGWADEKLFNDFTKISRLSGTPQTFVIFNGRYYGVFPGFGRKMLNDLEQTIIKTLDENNL